jgi:hypothetical protein
LFVGEGALLALAGALLGVIGAIGYASLMMLGLRTWWLGAVGTTMLRLELRPTTILAGSVAAMVISILCLVLTLRAVTRKSPRSLLTGTALLTISGSNERHGWRAQVSKVIYIVAAIGVVASIAGAATGRVGQTAAFFLTGVLLLVTSVRLCYDWMRSDKQATIDGSGIWSVMRLGFRNATARPGRSALCIALIASATFIISAVDAFRRDGATIQADRKSGTGGYGLVGESLRRQSQAARPSTWLAKNRLKTSVSNDFDSDQATTRAA